MRTSQITLAVATALAVAACQPPGSPGSVESTQQALGEDGGGAQFENAPGDDSDPFGVTNLPPTVTTRLHACQKIPYATLGNLLASRGVNLNATAGNGKPPTAGDLYRGSAGTLGAANYAARSREVIQQTTSGATKMMDVFLMAAPEIIAAMPGLKVCQIAGVPAVLFNNDNSCNATGIACLTGAPAVPAQVNLCNQMVADVAGPVGKQIAVAAILSAAHTCE